MSHQFQTQVLVDGVWTTRTVDTFDALARQSAPQVETKTKEPEIKNVEYLPGVLTKTLLSTPHTKFILPVKIRHGFINDVVFIGEYAVHLKEIQPDGSLRHIASMIDFRDRIIAAKVLSTSQANQEDAEYNDPVKKEDLATGSDAKRMSAVHMIPPEVIVLVLDSCDLMFLWTLQSEAGDIKFRHTAWRMPKTKHDQPGSLLAVDPKSRAIAVAYGERKFMLYKLKPVEEWQNELLGWAKTPIEEERQIRLSISNQEQHSGSPMHMDFLASRDDSHIVLLLVLAHRGWTKISCYDWDARCRLNTVTPRAERLSVDFEDHHPSLLIPSSHSPSFALIFDDHISLYVDILSGTINERRVVPVPKDSFVPLYPADSKTHPKWVQWHGFALQNEFYIAREDGKVIRLSLAQLKTPQVWEAGQLRFPVDKAFAALKLNSARNSPAHVFVAAGITSDGSVVKVEASAEGESETSEHIIPNWTPVHDMQVATNRMEDSTEPRQSLVIARGRAPFGEIAELRREIPVPIDGIGEGVKGCTDIWVVHYEAGPLDGEADGGKPPYAVLLLNLPLETLLLHVIRQDDTWNLANNGDPGAINLREETLAAGIVNGNFAIQINRSEAIIVRRPALTFVDSLKPTEKVFAASTEPGIPYFAIAYRCNDGLILEIVAISETGRLSSTIRIQLKDEPTCMQFITLNGNPHLFVGTFDGIHIFTMSSPAPLYTYSDPRIFENFALLEYGEDRVLLCGNRAGFLTSLNLVCGDSDIEMSPRSYVSMGPEPVRLARSESDPSIAFARTGKVFCRVHHRRPNSSVATIDSILFTDTENGEHSCASVPAFSQIPGCEAGSAHVLSGYIFAVSEDNLIIARLDDDIRGGSGPLRKSTLAPRRRLLEGTPSRLIPVGTQRLAVASMGTKQVRQPPNAYRTEPTGIELVEWGGSKTGQEGVVTSPSMAAVTASFRMQDYERALTMIYPKDFLRTKADPAFPYRFFIVGTSARNKDGKEYGRKLFFKIQGNSLVLEKAKVCESPVRSMAAFTTSMLLSLCGPVLTLEGFHYGEKRWILLDSVTLPSPGVFVTTDQDDSVIHVSTQESSHLCYTVAGNNGKISGRRLIRLEGDDRKRNLIHHIAVRTRYHPGLGGVNEEGVYEDPWERVILLTDKNCTVSGLFFRASALPYTLCANAEEEGEPIPVETHIAFEAQLPRSVTRLVKGNLRPPWGTPAFKRLGRLENAGYNVYEPHEFIGCSTDGTFHAIRLLSKRNLIILKCIQNLVEIKARRHSWLTPLHDRLGTPFLSRIFGDNNLRPSTSTPGSFSLGRGPGQLISRLDILGSFAHKKHVPKKNHVDGDVLERYLDGEIEGVEWDAKNALWTLFTARDVDEGVAKWFLQQVAVQVKELRATPAVQLILGGWLEGEDAELVGREGMGEVQDWVRRLLRDAV